MNYNPHSFTDYATPELMDFVVDTVGPRVRTEETRVSASDAVFPAEDLRFEYLHQGTQESGTVPAWTPGESEIPKGATAVRVLDGAGNATTLSLLPPTEEATPKQSFSWGSCSASGSGVGRTRDRSWPLFFVALVIAFYVLIRRKRRAIAPTLLLGLLVLFIRSILLFCRTAISITGSGLWVFETR